MARRYSMARRSAQKTATAARIRATVLKLLLEGGPEQVTLGRVAAGAGVAVGTVYRHYGSRDQLLAAAWDALAAQDAPFEPERARRHEPSPGTRLLIAAVFRSFEHNRGSIAPTLRLCGRGFPRLDRAVALVRRRRRRSIDVLLGAAARRGELALPLPAARLLLYSLTSFNSWEAAQRELGMAAAQVRRAVALAAGRCLFRANGPARAQAGGRRSQRASPTRRTA